MQDKKGERSEDNKRKPYTKPLIIHELELETRAGSPIPPFGAPSDPLNPTGADF